MQRQNPEEISSEEITGNIKSVILFTVDMLINKFQLFLCGLWNVTGLFIITASQTPAWILWTLSGWVWVYLDLSKEIFPIGSTFM